MIGQLQHATRIIMFRQLPKLLAAAIALLFVSGCVTHDRKEYQYPLGWKTRPATDDVLPPPPAELPPPTSPVAPVTPAPATAAPVVPVAPATPPPPPAQ